VQRTLTVRATQDTVRILDGQEVIAAHARSFDRGAQIENPIHIETLVSHKRAARGARAKDQLHHAAPAAQSLFLRAAARGVHLGALTRGLVHLLASHGAQALQRAIVAALDQDACHLGAVRHFIDQHARAASLPPPIALTLPADARVQAMSVRPHALTDYEQLSQQPPTRSPLDEHHHDDSKLDDSQRDDHPEP
jgi:hypothetical protein